MKILQPLVHRILSRLVESEAEELNPWMRDDLRIARLIVAHAARGDAVRCSPQVLASYEVLGLHPEKVWPAILARRTALGPLEVAPPKKPAQSVQLWFENSNGARAINSRAECSKVLREPTISVPMATQSIAALYPNSDAPSSEKKRGFSYAEMLAIVKFSGAPHSVRRATLNALSARGRWPNQDGPANGIICVSLDGMMRGNEDGDGNCVRSTARWRARQALKHGYWRKLRDPNSWSDCRNCGAKRATAQCGKCEYKGRSKTPEGKANFEEFCRPYMYEIDIEKFRSAQRSKELRHFPARTYGEYRESIRGGKLTEFPRKPSQPEPRPPAPAAPAVPVRQPAAEHAHRNPARPEPKPKLSKTDAAKLVADVVQQMRGYSRHTEPFGGLSYDLHPSDPRYRPKMGFEAALKAVCERWNRQMEVVRESLKFYGFSHGEDGG